MDIGKEVREIEFEPVTEPATVPEPVTVPQPEREPAHVGQ